MENTAGIVGIELSSEYQFRITPVSVGGPLPGGPFLSPWIRTPTDPLVPRGPLKLRVTARGPDSQGLRVRIEWQPEEGMPCFYRIACLPSSMKEPPIQLEVTPSPEMNSTDVTGLAYGIEYKILITSSYNINWQTESPASTVLYTTPSCLLATGHNFTLCPPPPPRNLTASPESENSTVIAWLEPEHTSSNNPVLTYKVTVINDVPLLEMDQHKPFKIQLETLGNETEITVEGLEPGVHYLVYVWPVSEAGRGAPASGQFRISDHRIGFDLALPSQEPREGGFTLILVSVIGSVLLVFTLMVLVCCFLRKRSLRKRVHTPREVPFRKKKRLCPFEVDFGQLAFSKRIGMGSFGVVFKGQLTLNGLTEVVAIKMLRDTGNSEERCHLWKEIELLKLLGRHPNIVCLRAYALSDETPGELAMTVEYCHFGDLHSHLRQMYDKSANTSLESGFCSDDSRGSLDLETEDEDLMKIWSENAQRLLSYALQVAEGMEFVRSCKLVHRDLAARNVLLQSLEKVKITDFGLGRDVYETGLYSPLEGSNARMPLRWTALEAISMQKYSTASDVWSFGVLLWEIMTFGMTPYPDISNKEVVHYLNSGKRLNCPSVCNQELFQVMSSCWSSQPRARPSFTDLQKKLGTSIEEQWYVLVQE